MALLGEHTRYCVRFVDDFENVIVDYVLASDVEHAAWKAFELSNRRQLTLVDVYLDD